MNFSIPPIRFTEKRTMAFNAIFLAASAYFFFRLVYDGTRQILSPEEMKKELLAYLDKQPRVIRFHPLWVIRRSASSLWFRIEGVLKLAIAVVIGLLVLRRFNLLGSLRWVFTPVSFVVAVQMSHQLWQAKWWL